MTEEQTEATTPQYITSGKAAARAGIPERTMRRYIRTKKVAGVQNPLTKRWKVDVAALDAFLLSNGIAPQK